MNTALCYDEDDLGAAYESLGLRPNDVAYVTGNLGDLGYPKERDKQAALEGHLGALRRALGPGGTLAVPTHTFSLCNTSRPYDHEHSASETGPLTEHVRRQPGSVRQFHPFSSTTALGPLAGEICGGHTRHVYGPHSPFARMIEKSGWCVSIGLPPRRTSTIVHHMELVMGVPYRYTKEFVHPVRRAGELRQETFYLFVTYRSADIVRDRNKRLFQHPLLRETVREARVGMGCIYAYRMRDFVQAADEVMSRDIYSWLERPPENRPYRV